MNSFWQPNFVATYFPNLTEMTDTALQSARDRLESYIRAGWPDEDLRPGSVVGDRVLTPFAHLLVAMETSAGRWMSDMDLSQVAQGVVFNCSFVRAFLKNFAVQEADVLTASGIVRLVFSSDTEIELTRQMQFQFGAVAFTLDLPLPGPMILQPVGSAPRAGTNHVMFRDAGVGRYSADVRVVGPGGTAVPSNEAATLDVTVANLLTASALADFDAGSEITSLATLAALTQRTFPAAALTSRKSAVSALLRLYPGILGVYPVLPGDALMLRSSVNPLGISSARADIHLRSSRYDFTSSVVVNIPFVDIQNSTSVRRFIARLRLPGYPTLIRDITSVENPEIVFHPGSTANVWSQSLNPARCPLLTCAGTEDEALWVSFEMPFDTLASTELLTTATDANGQRYAQFVVRYVHDPSLAAMAARIDGPDYKPANCEIMTRPFIPIVISQFQVRYTKQAGKSVNTAAARAEILAYLRSISFPGRYSDARVADALFYRNADDVRGIALQARVWWSAANLVLPAGVAGPDVDHTTALAAARVAPALFINNTRDMVLSDFIDPLLGTGGETMAAAGAANACFLVDAEQITFVEDLN